MIVASIVTYGSVRWAKRARLATSLSRRSSAWFICELPESYVHARQRKEVILGLSPLHLVNERYVAMAAVPLSIKNPND